jgi:hypothetical protein
MAQQIKDSRLLKLVNMDHMAPVTDPDPINALLVDYVVPMIEATAASAGARCA